MEIINVIVHWRDRGSKLSGHIYCPIDIWQRFAGNRQVRWIGVFSDRKSGSPLGGDRVLTENCSFRSLPGVGQKRLGGPIMSVDQRDVPQGVPPPPDPAGQEAFDKAKALLFVDSTACDDEGRPITVSVPSPLYRNYQGKKKAYDDALAAYNANRSQYDLSNPADARKWSIMGPVLQRSVDQAWADLQGARPGVVESALATIRQYQQSESA